MGHPIASCAKWFRLHDFLITVTVTKLAKRVKNPVPVQPHARMFECMFEHPYRLFSLFRDNNICVVCAVCALCV